MKPFFTSFCAAAVLSVTLLAGCTPAEIPYEDTANSDAVLSTVPDESDNAAPEPTQPEEEPKYITIRAVGDNILHNTVIKAGAVGDTYDFTPMYEYVADDIASADIAVINQESPLGGEGYKPSGYPRFNSPQVLGDQLVEIGFDVISHANNHAMDAGAGAVYDTIDFWDKYKDQGVLMTGIYRDEEDRDELRIMTKNDISVGFLSYTYGTNGIPLPASNPNLVSLIDDDRIAYDMERLVPNCDVTVVIMHWGNEYQTTPSDEQKRLAKYLTELGADIIIGHHPHVIQPAEYIEADNGNKAFCVYSLGNFVSSQDKVDRLIESMLTITVKKEDGVISVENPYLTPLITYYDKQYETYKVYPLSLYNEEISKTHKLSALTPEYASTFVSKILGDYLQEEYK